MRQLTHDQWGQWWQSACVGSTINYSPKAIPGLPPLSARLPGRSDAIEGNSSHPPHTARPKGVPAPPPPKFTKAQQAVDHATSMRINRRREPEERSPKGSPYATEGKFQTPASEYTTHFHTKREEEMNKLAQLELEKAGLSPKKEKRRTPRTPRTPRRGEGVRGASREASAGETSGVSDPEDEWEPHPLRGEIVSMMSSRERGLQSMASSYPMSHPFTDDILRVSPRSQAPRPEESPYKGAAHKTALERLGQHSTSHVLPHPDLKSTMTRFDEKTEEKKPLLPPPGPENGVGSGFFRIR